MADQFKNADGRTMDRVKRRVMEEIIEQVVVEDEDADASCSRVSYHLFKEDDRYVQSCLNHIYDGLDMDSAGACSFKKAEGAMCMLLCIMASTGGKRTNVLERHCQYAVRLCFPELLDTDGAPVAAATRKRTSSTRTVPDAPPPTPPPPSPEETDKLRRRVRELKRALGAKSVQVRCLELEVDKFLHNVEAVDLVKQMYCDYRTVLTSKPAKRAKVARSVDMDRCADDGEPVAVHGDGDYGARPTRSSDTESTKSDCGGSDAD